MSIDSDDLGLMAGEAQTKDARVGSVHEPQPDSLAASDRGSFTNAPIHRHGVADAAIVSHVVHVAEIVADLRIGKQAPVLQHPHHIAIYLDWLALLDDQGV
jgi:hypothetical protein